MKVLIIEDEKMAMDKLAGSLKSNFSDIDIIGTASSVKSAVEWIKAHGKEVDTIFMDVELGDGDCFQIFRETDIKANVVMTTAYDSYAIKAFEAGSLDYLLKPIDPAALERAVKRCRERLSVPDTAALVKAFPEGKAYKDSFTIRIGDSLVPVRVQDILWFMSADKSNFLCASDGQEYIVDSSMDSIEEKLDPNLFFRTSRGFIVSRGVIVKAKRHINGRLILQTKPDAPKEITVSRARVDDFLKWLG